MYYVMYQKGTCPFPHLCVRQLNRHVASGGACMFYKYRYIYSEIFCYQQLNLKKMHYTCTNTCICIFIYQYTRLCVYTYMSGIFFFKQKVRIMKKYIKKKYLYLYIFICMCNCVNMSDISFFNRKSRIIRNIKSVCIYVIHGPLTPVYLESL